MQPNFNSVWSFRSSFRLPPALRQQMTNVHFDHKHRRQAWVFFFGARAPQRARVSSFTSFLYHMQRRTTIGRTPLDEWSARRKDLYLTTHNTHNRQTSMPPVGFEATISAGERPQTYALDRQARVLGRLNLNTTRTFCDDNWSDNRAVFCGR